MTVPDIIMAGILAVVLAAAVGHDLATRRIPNALTFPLAAAALVLGALFGGLPGFLNHLWGAVLVGGLWFLFWHLGIMGGGDQKLMLMAGAFVGRGLAMPLIFTVAVLGGLQALAWIAVRRLREGPHVAGRELWRRTSLPYSIAIAGGAALTIAADWLAWWPEWLRPFLDLV